MLCLWTPFRGGFSFWMYVCELFVGVGGVWFCLFCPSNVFVCVLGEGWCEIFVWLQIPTDEDFPLNILLIVVVVDV